MNSNRDKAVLIGIVLLFIGLASDTLALPLIIIGLVLIIRQLEIQLRVDPTNRSQQRPDDARAPAIRRR